MSRDWMSKADRFNGRTSDEKGIVQQRKASGLYEKKTTLAWSATCTCLPASPFPPSTCQPE